MPTPFGTAIVNGDFVDASHINLLRTAVNQLENGTTQFAVATGAVNVLAVTLTPAVTALAAGFEVAFQVNTTNTGAATLNVNGIAAVAIKRPNGDDVQAGDLLAGSIYIVRHNGTNWRLVSLPEARIDKGLGTPTEVGNVGSGEDPLQQVTIPGNSLLINGQRAIVEFAVSFAANGNSKQVKAFCGATQVFASGAQNQNGGSMLVRVTMMRDGASAQKVGVEVLVSASSLFTSQYVYTTTALTMSSDIVIKLTGEATADNDIVGEMALPTYG